MRARKKQIPISFAGVLRLVGDTAALRGKAAESHRQDALARERACRRGGRSYSGTSHENAFGQGENQRTHAGCRIIWHFHFASPLANCITSDQKERHRPPNEN
jgi:hypothetical protein